MGHTIEHTHLPSGNSKLGPLEPTIESLHWRRLAQQPASTRAPCGLAGLHWPHAHSGRLTTACVIAREPGLSPLLPHPGAQLPLFETVDVSHFI